MPVSTYFSNLDQALDHLPDARVFMASDSEFVVRRFNNRYGSRIYTLPTQRSEFGEMHVRGCAENIGMEFDTYRLGLEVLTEAWILASTDVLVHGNSNVSNFILCLNPLLENIYVEA